MKLRWFVQDKEGGDAGAGGGGQGGQGAGAGGGGQGGQGAGAGGGQQGGGQGGQGGGQQGSGQGQGQGGTGGQSQWPDKWRESYAGDDAKKLSALQRYGSPTAALDALLAAQQKISSGELKVNRPFPEKGTKEEQDAWRTEAGIPLDPKGYEIKPAEGVVIGEQDKPLIEKFVANMHRANAHPSVVNAAINTYYQLQEEQVAAQQAADAQFQTESEDKLRLEMGADFRKNMTIVKNFLAAAPAGLGDRIMGARLADGRMLGDDPDALRWLSELGRKMNPVATVTGGVGPAAMDAMATELANLKKLMGDHSSEYWTGPNAAKNQARYRELIGAQQAAQGGQR